MPIEIIPKSKTKQWTLGVIFALILLASSISALGIMTYIWIYNSDVDVTVAGDLMTDMPISDNFIAGTMHNYTYNITNNANSSLNFELEFYITEVGLETNESMLRIYDSSDVELAYNSTMNIEIISVKKVFVINPLQSVTGHVSVQMAQNADNLTYTLGLGITDSGFSFS